MAKTTGPLLSIGANGQIAHSQVYATWKGIPYARRYVIPANPNTVKQATQRTLFTNMDWLWKMMGPLVQQTWTAAAKGRPLVNRNLEMSQNIKALLAATDFTNLIFSPGNGGGLAANAVAATAGSTAGSITVTVTPPTVPEGWNLIAAFAAAYPNGSPATRMPDLDVEGTATTSPYTIDLAGLTSGTPYIVGGWLSWTRVDGTTVYGRSKTTTVTPT